ncbi:putative F-box protein At5g15660 [Capsella rubella]|uniref:putative F-box protein At5g15660 n=1 Tax=Capsella rubella TaxID=81985 RepID=UPI000CD4F7CB|nr:putative F-box protein At5g15660 [Capsella rubella]
MEKNQRENKVMKTSDSIPHDLLFEILLRLPVKSVTRFISVSNLFASIIRSQGFMKSFSLRSSKQKQCLLLAYDGVDEEKVDKNWFFISSSEKSSSPVMLSRMACLHAPELSRYTPPRVSCVHGLLSFVYGEEQIIINPSNGKYITLRSVKSRRKVLKRFFGYDPVDGQHKVLCLTEPMFGSGTRVAASGQCQVLTLESSLKNLWRQIKCSIPHRPQSEGLCTNGVLYYYAHMGKEFMEPSLVRFDVRSETFEFLTKLPVEIQNSLKSSNLISYKGNVASATSRSHYSYDLWLLEDFKKQQWIKVNLSASPNTTKRYSPIDLRGIAHTGEVIYASLYLDNFYLIIHDRDTNVFKVVDIIVNSYKSVGFAGVVCFIDFVESVMFS